MPPEYCVQLRWCIESRAQCNVRPVNSATPGDIAIAHSPNSAETDRLLRLGFRRRTIMPQAATDEIYFNQWDPEFRANPYPHYKPMLAGPPRIINVKIPATPDLLKMFGLENSGLTELPLPTALATRYQDCLAILRDPQRFSSSRPTQEKAFEDRGPFKGATTML